MDKTGLIRLSEACRRLSVPYNTVYSGMHKVAEAFGLVIIGKGFFCSEEKITEIAKRLKGYAYISEADRDKSVKPWMYSRALLERGYIHIGCLGFVKEFSKLEIKS